MQGEDNAALYSHVVTLLLPALCNKVPQFKKLKTYVHHGQFYINKANICLHTKGTNKQKSCNK